MLSRAYVYGLIRHNGAGVVNMNTETPLEDWVTKEQFVDMYPAISLSQLKYLIRTRHYNGLSEAKAVAKVGGRVLIHKRKFATWVNSKAC